MSNLQALQTKNLDILTISRVAGFCEFSRKVTSTELSAVIGRQKNSPTLTILKILTITKVRAHCYPREEHHSIPTVLKTTALASGPVCCRLPRHGVRWPHQLSSFMSYKLGLSAAKDSKAAAVPAG